MQPHLYPNLTVLSPEFMIQLSLSLRSLSPSLTELFNDHRCWTYLHLHCRLRKLTFIEIEHRGSQRCVRDRYCDPNVATCTGSEFSRRRSASELADDFLSDVIAIANNTKPLHELLLRHLTQWKRCINNKIFKLKK